jgi:hypothetical protein
VFQRTLQLTVAGATRTEEYQGREHLVVPVVALVEGVVHAMNSAYPEFVSAKEFSRAPQGWNGRPVFLGHPTKAGRPVSGNTPDILEEKSIGIIFNTLVAKKKLCMEAWIDVEKANAVDSALLERIRANEEIQISVGVLVETDDEEGSFNGKKYLGAWHDLVPDHLALLPAEDAGACNWDMGCGVRAAAAIKGGVDMEPTKDVKQPGGFLSRIAGLIRAARSSEEMTANDMRREIYDELKPLEPALLSVEDYNPTQGWVVFSVSENTGGQYGYGYCLYQRAYSVDAAGKVTINGDRVEVEIVTSYEPVDPSEDEGVTVAAGKAISKKNLDKIQAMHDHSVALGAACQPGMKGAAAGAPCSCKQAHAPKQAKENSMTKEALVKFLETATPEQIEKLGLVAEGKETPVVVPVVEPKAAAAVPAVVETPKAATFEEVLATASPETREVISEGIRVAKDRKAVTIKALKDTGRCDLSDEVLAGKSQAELDQLVKLAGSNVRAAIDFGVNAPRDNAPKPQTVEAPPDLGAAVRAARGQK